VFQQHQQRAATFQSPTENLIQSQQQSHQNSFEKIMRPTQIVAHGGFLLNNFFDILNTL